MKITQSTIDLVKRFEGLELTSYRDPVGIWTVGYGTTSNAGIGVSVGADMRITEEKAEEWLMAAMQLFANEIRPLFTVQPNANQFGAMLSLAYNIGTTAFAKSTCLRRFNSGDARGAAEALTWFNKAGGKKLRGLVRRREAEYDLFMKGADVVVASVTPDAERSIAGSTTNLSALGGTIAAFGSLSDTAKGAIGSLTENFGVSPDVAMVAIIALCFGWVFRERIRKFAAGDR